MGGLPEVRVAAHPRTMREAEHLPEVRVAPHPRTMRVAVALPRVRVAPVRGQSEIRWIRNS